MDHEDSGTPAQNLVIAVALLLQKFTGSSCEANSQQRQQRRP
jgi:hypothetical protein